MLPSLLNAIEVSISLDSVEVPPSLLSSVRSLLDSPEVPPPSLLNSLEIASSHWNSVEIAPTHWN